jgi:tRNA threonylcarbamoyladenosine biosynthesis protein TsaE
MGEQGTSELARCAANASRPGDVICLWGNLGIGKTVFARAFIRTLGDLEAEVPSPTFTLVQTYGPFAAVGCLVHHFDLFRIEDTAELHELGFEDAVLEGIVLVEWPERLGPLLPASRLDIRFTAAVEPDARQIAIDGSSGWEMRLRGRAVE